MGRNVEIKARVTDIRGIGSLVRSLGAVGPEELIQTDTFFNVSAGRLKLREFGDGTAELIAYDRPDLAGPKLSDYVRAPIQEPTALREALTRSLGVRAIVRKRRVVFLLGQTRVHLDDVEDLGAFIELEVVLQKEQSEEDGRQIATALLNALSVPECDLIPAAYVDLLAR